MPALIAPDVSTSTSERLAFTAYARRRVIETCAAQGLPVKPDDAVLETVASVLATIGGAAHATT